MKYYNVHTHCSSEDPATVEIVNTVIRKETVEANAPHRSYGIHPWYLENVEEQFKTLREFALQKETIAIGEAGLDKLANTDFSIQKNIFHKQALLAEEIRKPLIIHCVKAWPELFSMKKEIKPSIPWIIHGLRGKPELAQQLIDHGFYLSFGAEFNPASLHKAWPKYILAETDDEDISIQQVYTFIAQTLSLPLETIADILAENSNHIFSFFK